MWLIIVIPIIMILIVLFMIIKLSRYRSYYDNIFKEELRKRETNKS